MKEVIEKIIRELENASHFTESTYDEDGYSNDDSEEVINLCKAVEIVKRVLEDGWWIPVEERLPEDKQQVLVTNWDYCVVLARYDENEKRFYNLINKNDNLKPFIYGGTGIDSSNLSMPKPIRIETPTSARCNASESIESLKTVCKPAEGRSLFLYTPMRSL